MNKRIKELRNALGMTQEEFAKRIGVKRNTIATYEMGRSTPSDAGISLICREFNVNEDWLRSGSGEMFLPQSENAIDALVRQYHLSDASKALLITFCELSEDDQDMILNFVSKAAENIKTMSGIEAAEAAYAEALGFAKDTESSTLSSTEDTQNTEKENDLLNNPEAE